MTTPAERAFFGERIDLTRPPQLPDAIARALAASPAIRTLNQVAIKLMRVLDDPRSSAATVEQALQGDVGLAARVLRVANSSFYGGVSAATGVKQAIARMGFESVRAIALATAMHQKNLINSDVGTRLARHSVGVAVLSRLLAQRLRKADPDLAFMAGLLHDIGKFALLQCFPERYERLATGAFAAGWPFCDLETRAFGCDHAAVGAALTYSWGLHPRLLVAIRLHHDIGTLHAIGPDPWTLTLVATVRLADDLFRAHLTPTGELSPEPTPVVSEAADLLGFDSDALGEAWSELLDHYHEAILVLL